jgi:hypothetical protein
MLFLYDIGVSLHYPDVIAFIRYAQENKMETVISMSLSIIKDDAFLYGLITHLGSLSHHSFAEIWNGAEIARVRDPQQIIHRIGCNKCRE